MNFTLDHVVIGVRDLEAATDHYAALFGRTPSWRGEHPTYGTRNTLFRIENTYVELLSMAKDAKSSQVAGELPRFLERGEGVYALALGSADIAADVRELRNRGIPAQQPVEGHGIDQISGARRDWKNAMVPVKSTNGARIFFIEHVSPPDALPEAAVAVTGQTYVRRMDHAVVLSPDMESAKRLWSGVLDARLALDRTFPERNTRILFFRLGDITIEMSGGATQTEEGLGKPDRLWGLAWGVGSVEETVLRLRAQGIDVSDPRRGIKPGTKVATVKGVHTHGVATLLIEHTEESFQPASRRPQGAAFDNDPGRRAFALKALDHVSLAVDDGEAAARTWRDTLGLSESEAFQTTGAHMRLSKIPAGNAFMELVQPLKSEGRVATHIASRGPGMFGVALEVDDVDRAVADLRAKGVTVSDSEYGAWPGTRTARIDPSSANGVNVVLVQRLPEIL
jgi:methylmalonyl-CoA epimerase